jgi:hypothetical protein
MNDRDSTGARSRRFPLMRKSGWFLGAGATSAVAVLAMSGVASAATTSPSASSAPTPSASATSAPGGSGRARSGPADGGATGTIESTAASSFTLQTWTGIDVTVDETSATKVKGGPAKDVRKGTSVLVLGLVNDETSTTTITAAQVDVQRHGDGGAKAGQRDGVEAATPGTPGPTKSVGTIPSDYTEGDGTIVSGAQAYAAVAAAQAVFPGGIVDRVVELPDGGYEVHNIGIAWPHHVFVNSASRGRTTSSSTATTRSSARTTNHGRSVGPRAFTHDCRCRPPPARAALLPGRGHAQVRLARAPYRVGDEAAGLQVLNSGSQELQGLRGAGLGHAHSLPDLHEPSFDYAESRVAGDVVRHQVPGSRGGLQTLVTEHVDSPVSAHHARVPKGAGKEHVMRRVPHHADTHVVTIDVSDRDDGRIPGHHEDPLDYGIRGGEGDLRFA